MFVKIAVIRYIKSMYHPRYENSWALVIGINKYLKAGPLKYARNDAEAIADLLVSKFNFPKEYITRLLDEDATAQNIRTQFQKFFGEHRLVGPNDRIVVFYAGHGHTISGLRGEVGYLVPVDGDLSDYSTLLRWDTFTRDADLIDAKHILFIMDACYGGLAVTRSHGTGTTRFLKDMLKRRSRQVIAGGKADQTVSDAGGPLPEHSVFTGHFIEALNGKGANKDGVITAVSTMAYVYHQVSTDRDSHQTPHFGAIDGDGDLIFNPESFLKDTDSSTTDKDVLIEYPIHELHMNDTKETHIDRIKEYISNSNYRIKLDDAITLEVKAVLEKVSDLSMDIPVTQENILERLHLYESASKYLREY